MNAFTELLCLFGLHSWIRKSNRPNGSMVAYQERTCKHCGKHQERIMTALGSLDGWHD